MIVVPGTATSGSSTYWLDGAGAELAGVTVWIGDGATRGGYRNGSLSIDRKLGSRGQARAQFVDLDSSWAISPGESFAVYFRGVLVFRGTVESVSEVIPGMRKDAAEKFLDVLAVDHSQIADRHLVAGIYEDPAQTTGDVVRAIVTNYLAADGVSAAGVQDGLALGRMVVDYRSAADVFNRLGKLTGYDWYIDNARVLHFFSRESRPAPWGISDASKPFLRLSCERTRARYRNSQVMRSGRELAEERRRNIEANGTDSSWDVEFPIGAEPQIWLDGIVQTVGIRGVDDDNDPGGYQFFWQKDSRAISQNRAHDEVTGTITVEYRPLIPIRVAAKDDDEVAARIAVEGGSGLYEAIEDDDRIESSDLAVDAAVALLRKHGKIACVVSVVTDSPGLRVGALQSIELTDERLSGEYLIETMTVSDIGGRDGHLRYQYRALSGESVGGWPEFFQRLAAGGRRFIDQENETLLLLSSAASDIVISDALTVDLSDTLVSEPSDTTTSWKVGYGKVGLRYVYDGTTYNRGPRVGAA